MDGPHFLRPAPEGALGEGFFYGLVWSIQEVGDSLGCSFPSSHVAGAVTMAYLGWRWLPRSMAGLLTLVAAGVAASCVYSRNHYAVDAVAGIVWGLGVQRTAAPVLRRALGGSSGRWGTAVATAARRRMKSGPER